MSNHQAIIAMIKHISGQANVLTIPRVFIDLTGSVTSALFLSQCIYWSDRSGVGGGWFAKTLKEWRDETGLTRANVESAARECMADENGAFLETMLARFNGSPTTHYRVDMEKLAVSICRILQIDLPDQANPFVEIQQMDLYENDKTSTETTTKTSTKKKKKTEPRPAWVDIYHSVYSRYPRKETWATVAEKLGGDFDVEKLRGIFQEWALHENWNHGAFDKMLAVYRDGWREPQTRATSNGNGSAHATPAARPLDIVRIYKD